MRHCLIVAAVLFVAGCSLVQPPPPPQRVPAPQPAPTEKGPEPPPVEQPRVEPLPEPRARAPMKEHKFSLASQSLVNQARAQTAKGEFPVAAASVERALRIEPDNPLLWIELGKVRQAEGNYAQAEHMGKKALSLSSGDLKAQVTAWQLVARSLRARGRNDEALIADARADALMPD